MAKNVVVSMKSCLELSIQDMPTSYHAISSSYNYYNSSFDHVLLLNLAIFITLQNVSLIVAIIQENYLDVSGTGKVC